ncbi:LON peptidase substrate-binding domain-containing protein [Ancylobacter defluvii]|uniref:ATP-dependent protease n=1 Tax=Ancylobacter defluvii TaxID=1282440 RepID=A0A9W6K1T4_9HYPH|nr:LON peptidase substrate-binding domain-containing protein [Ancylobacter defluvii]MBS7587085.1 LON peptidase substrate-binding domain-containing protein [Ancylobacter defluvii]GLK85388.1 ATP-dependent protease [Ancylobacter defluvii]
MAINRPYGGPAELPSAVPLFPLEGALLLPRCQLPLNVFEPRYLAMIDDALKGERIIGIVQPVPALVTTASPALQGVGCLGRITEFAESGDGRYIITLTGVARFRLVEEVAAATLYRQARIGFSGFEDDFTPNLGADAVDRGRLLKTLAAYLDANRLEADWESIKDAPNEALVNALAMMSPFGAREKQALLEASDLAARAEMLIAVTEMALARGPSGESETPLQ